MADENKLYGQKEVAAFVATVNGNGSTWYVSAMKRAGCPFEFGYVITESACRRWLYENPNFNAKKMFRPSSAKVGQGRPSSAKV